MVIYYDYIVGHLICIVKKKGEREKGEGRRRKVGDRRLEVGGRRRNVRRSWFGVTLFMEMQDAFLLIR